MECETDPREVSKPAMGMNGNNYALKRDELLLQFRRLGPKIQLKEETRVTPWLWGGRMNSRPPAPNGELVLVSKGLQTHRN